MVSEELQKNIGVDGDMMIDIRTGDVLGTEVDYTCWKEKFNSQIYSLHRP